MDKKTRIKTVFVFLIFALLTGFLILKSDNHIGLLVFAILLSLTYLTAWTFGLYKTPISYKVLNGDLLIISRFSQVSISIREIRNLRIFDSEDRKGLIRIFGAEGVFTLWIFIFCIQFGNFARISRTKIITNWPNFIFNNCLMLLFFWSFCYRPRHNIYSSKKHPRNYTWSLWLSGIYINANKYLDIS
jgi:hypothetical protein